MPSLMLPARLQNRWIAIAALTLFVVAVSAQSFLADSRTFMGSTEKYTQYNNYVIFRQSFLHLIAGRDLYQLYPAEHWDLFKYSPTFALLMAPFAWLPDPVGVTLWNLCNAMLLAFALWTLPSIDAQRRLIMLAFVSVELVTSIQSEQSNGLVAGLIVVAFSQLEARRVVVATLCIALTVLIKLFGVLAFALLLFYPGRVRAVLYSLGWLVSLALLPLLVIEPAQLAEQYRSWAHMLTHDESMSYGVSVSGWLRAWFGVTSKRLVLLAGVALFCLPMARVAMYRDQRFRALFLASILLWVVIFNHKAESPTFVIAVSGVAIWAAVSERSPINIALLLLTVVFTILATTDVYPYALRSGVFVPYAVKAVPCILVWARIVVDQLMLQPSTRDAVGSAVMRVPAG